MDSLFEIILLFTAAMIAGAMNAVAGGGTILTFPALIFCGVPPIIANATSTIALWPGAMASCVAYRKELKPLLSKLPALFVASLIGGLVGAVLLLKTPEKLFDELVPYLLMFATLAFAFSGVIRRAIGLWLKKRNQQKASSNQPVATGVQFLISVYGGYFGAGMGIMMHALLGIAMPNRLNETNGIRVLLGSAINSTAVVIFAAAGVVAWKEGILMLVAAVLGGYYGAAIAKKAPENLLRGIITAIGVGLSLYYWVS